MSNFTQFGGGSIKSIQRGVIALSAGTLTNTATLSPSVDTTKCELRCLGYTLNANDASMVPYVTLTNSTTVTATRQASAATIANISWEITERY